MHVSQDLTTGVKLGLGEVRKPAWMSGLCSVLRGVCM